MPGNKYRFSMTIAAHISSGQYPSYSFLEKYLSALAEKYPQEHFIFFIEKDHTPLANTPKNITHVSISPNIKNSLLLHYWFNYKLPFLLKRYNAAVLVTENGVISSKVNIPQIMVIKEVSLLKKMNYGQQLFPRYHKKYFAAFIKRSSQIITTEKYLQQLLETKYPSAEGRTITVYPELDKDHQPLSWQQKEKVTAEYSNEKDYFVFPLSGNTSANILHVLKAFSKFKKWQRSAMQLVFLVQNTTVKGLVKDLHLYRYKDEIKFISAGNEKEAAKIISAAYALIYLPAGECIDHTSLNAMRSEVPVITIGTDLNKSMYEDAALYTTLNEKDISEKMSLLYKDEHLRNSCIKKGVLQTAKYDTADTTEQLWRSIINSSEA